LDTEKDILLCDCSCFFIPSPLRKADKRYLILFNIESIHIYILFRCWSFFADEGFFYALYNYSPLAAVIIVNSILQEFLSRGFMNYCELRGEIAGVWWELVCLSQVMDGKRKMQRISGSLTFKCSGCEETFEFDSVDEYQLVPCPICGIELMTIRKKQALQLEPFEFTQENQITKSKLLVPGNLELR